MAEEPQLETMTIAGLFKSRQPNADEMANALNARDFSQIASKTGSWRKPIPWSVMQQKIAEVIAATLNSPVLDAYVNAWQKYGEIIEKAEASLKSRKPVECSVIEHSVESQITPQIDVFLNRIPIGTIQCAVGLTTHFEGLNLELVRGRIVAIRLARCSWSGRIAANDVTLVERDFGAWDLPGRIELKKPLRIAASA